MAEQEGKVQTERSPWADLPGELLCEVYSRLYAADRAALRCVCLSWKLACSFFLTTTRRSQLPLTNKSVCDVSPYLLFQNNKLCHPMIHDVFHHIDLLVQPGTIVRMAKNGWFLMTCVFRELFFYNPITKERVQLPDIYQVSQGDSMYFSAPPTSKGWSVIIAKSIGEDWVEIYCIKDGDLLWSSRQFKMKTQFKLTNCNAVMLKGQYYFLCKYGNLMVYDPSKKNVKFHRGISGHLELQDYGGEQYLLESDGKLLVVFVSCDGHFVRVLQWDPISKRWETVVNLDHKMLFVSAISSMCERASLKGTCNKIYFPRLVDDQCLFYSLSTKKYHTFEGGCYGDFNIKGSKIFKIATWIKPRLISNA